MQEIKYEFDKKRNAFVPCNYFPQAVCSTACLVCEYFKGGDHNKQVINCTFDESFLGRCLTALNWRRGDEASIVKALEAARELLKAMQEPTDAPNDAETEYKERTK